MMKRYLILGALAILALGVIGAADFHSVSTPRTQDDPISVQKISANIAGGPCSAAIATLVASHEEGQLFSIVTPERDIALMAGLAKWRPLSDFIPASWLIEDPEKSSIRVPGQQPFIAEDGFNYPPPEFPSNYDVTIIHSKAGKYVFVREAQYTKPGPFITVHFLGPISANDPRSDSDLLLAAFHSPSFTWPPGPANEALSMQKTARTSDQAYALLDVLDTNAGPMWVILNHVTYAGPGPYLVTIMPLAIDSNLPTITCNAEQGERK